jgi:integrase
MDQFVLPLTQPLMAGRPAKTLADVYAIVADHPTLPHLRKRDLLSALRTAERLANADLRDIEATLPRLRKIFDTTSRATGGFGQGHLNNLRSRLPAALRLAEVPTLARRTRQPLSPQWEDVRAQLPTVASRYGLSSLMSYCSAQRIVPAEVTEATFKRFLAALENDSLRRAPRQIYRQACQLWNEAAEHVSGWPSLIVPVPNLSRRYAMHWEEFPPSFRQDAEAFLGWSGNLNPFDDDYAKPVSPATAALWRRQILEIATALVRSGVPADQVTNLRVLVDPTGAELVLRFFLARNANAKTISTHQKALLLRTIARRWVKAPPDVLEKLKAFASRLAPKRGGMTDKNRQRLRQFDNARNEAALLNLPERVLAETLRSKAKTLKVALRLMLALAIDILINAPLRINNLTGLRTDRHLVVTGSRRSATAHIAIPAEEMKTRNPYEFILPSSTVKLLKVYNKYRPHITSVASPWLFPNQRGGRRSTTTLGRAMVNFIARETGIKMNVHLFRHFATDQYLKENPHDIETVRLLLGHQSQSTTLRAYAKPKTADAVARYDAMIAQKRNGPSGRGRT